MEIRSRYPQGEQHKAPFHIACHRPSADLGALVLAAAVVNSLTDWHGLLAWVSAILHCLQGGTLIKLAAITFPLV